MPNTISMSRVIKTWWPLAASWLLMGLELPMLSAVVARLPQPEINLAAYGGIVFPLALIIESPIIMLLAASTALSKDWPSYQFIRRVMMTLGAVLTSLHILAAFTPLYYVIAQDILGAPQAIVEPGRIGLMLLTPWTWSIAFRRFNQGALIRFGRSQTIGVGTFIRLSSEAIILAAGYFSQAFPGIQVAAGAVAVGVLSEALYVGIIARPTVNGPLRSAPFVEKSLTLSSFVGFYTPLVMTSLLTLVALPIASAAVGRMPQALESLAVWPVVSGLVFIFRSVGMAYNEVVVALLDEAGSYNSLKRFTLWLGMGTSLLLLLLAVTPLSGIYLQNVSALSPQLADLARTALWLALPLPYLAALQSWYQGIIVQSKRTGSITVAVMIYLLVDAALLAAGVVWNNAIGIYVGLGAMSLSMAAQTLWLWRRSLVPIAAIQHRDRAATASSLPTPGSSL
jgi:hypothetical protein